MIGDHTTLVELSRLLVRYGIDEVEVRCTGAGFTMSHGAGADRIVATGSTLGYTAAAFVRACRARAEEELRARAEVARAG